MSFFCLDEHEHDLQSKISLLMLGLSSQTSWRFMNKEESRSLKESQVPLISVLQKSRKNNWAAGSSMLLTAQLLWVVLCSPFNVKDWVTFKEVYKATDHIMWMNKPLDLIWFVVQFIMNHIFLSFLKKYILKKLLMNQNIIINNSSYNILIKDILYIILEQSS